MTDIEPLAELFLRRHLRQAVTVLEACEPDDVAALVAELDDDLGVDLLTAMPLPMAATCTTCLSDERAARLLLHMPRRRAAALLRQLPESRRSETLRAMPTATRLQLEMLLLEPSHRVGAWINTQPLVMAEDATIDQARRRLRRGGPPVTEVYVVDAGNGLIGLVPVSELFATTGSALLQSIAIAPPAVLRSGATVESALENPAWGDVDSLPVVNRSGHFVGTVRHAQLRQAILHRSARSVADDGDDYMSLANNVYVGLAEVFAGSISRPTRGAPASQPEGERS